MHNTVSPAWVLALRGAPWGDIRQVLETKEISPSLPAEMQAVLPVAKAGHANATGLLTRLSTARVRNLQMPFA